MNQRGTRGGTHVLGKKLLAPTALGVPAYETLDLARLPLKPCSTNLFISMSTYWDGTRESVSHRFSSGAASWKKCTGQSMRTYVELPHSLQKPLLPNFHMPTNLEALQTTLLGFMKVSFHRHDRLNYWPLATDSISRRSPLPEVRVWNWKFQSFNRQVASPSNYPLVLS